MPHLTNCPHEPVGWCLDCVKELHDEKTELAEVVVTLLGGEVDDAVNKGRSWASKILKQWQEDNPDDNGLKIV